MERTGGLYRQGLFVPKMFRLWGGNIAQNGIISYRMFNFNLKINKYGIVIWEKNRLNRNKL